MKINFDFSKAYLKKEDTSIILGYKGIGEQALTDDMLKDYITNIGPLIIPDTTLFSIAIKHSQYIDFLEI